MISSQPHLQNTKYQIRNTNSGFTLIEILITVSIMLILGITIIPSSIQRTRRQTIISNTEQASEFINQAANNARNSVEGSVWSITLSPSINQITRTCEDCSPVETENFIIDDQITVTSSIPNDFIVFNKNTGQAFTPDLTQPLTAPATMQLDLDNFTTTITINPSGSIQVTTI